MAQRFIRYENETALNDVLHFTPIKLSRHQVLLIGSSETPFKKKRIKKKPEPGIFQQNIIWHKFANKYCIIDTLNDSVSEPIAFPRPIRIHGSSYYMDKKMKIAINQKTGTFYFLCPNGRFTSYNLDNRSTRYLSYCSDAHSHNLLVSMNNTLYRLIGDVETTNSLVHEVWNPMDRCFRFISGSPLHCRYVDFTYVAVPSQDLLIWIRVEGVHEEKQLKHIVLYRLWLTTGQRDEIHFDRTLSAELQYLESFRYPILTANQNHIIMMGEDQIPEPDPEWGYIEIHRARMFVINISDPYQYTLNRVTLTMDLTLDGTGEG